MIPQNKCANALKLTVATYKEKHESDLEEF